MTAIELDVVVPVSLCFGDLELQVTPAGGISLEWAPVAALCEASGIDDDALRNGPAVLLPLVLRGWLELLAERGTPFVGHAQACKIIDRMLAEAVSAGQSPFTLQMSIGQEEESGGRSAGQTLH